MDRESIVTSLQKFALTAEKIKVIATSNQSREKGYAIASCGDVQGLLFDFSGSTLKVVGYVHSEKTSALYYKSSVTLTSDSQLGTYVAD